MVQDLDKRIEDEKKTCSALRYRYQELLESIECIESEIVASERSLKLLEDQKLRIGVDSQKLRGLIHPIRRCPLDVLQQIFEWAVEVDDDWFLCATVLSQVCQHWRSVSVRTPYLWKEIEVSSTSKKEDVIAFWSRTVERVKAAAAHVFIDDKPLGDLDWYKSELISSARCEVSTVTRAGNEYTMYNFRWD